MKISKLKEKARCHTSKAIHIKDNFIFSFLNMILDHFYNAILKTTCRELIQANLKLKTDFGSSKSYLFINKNNG